MNNPEFSAKIRQIQPVKTVEDVEVLARHLRYDLSVYFHPEDSFHDMVAVGTGEPSFTDEEADFLDGIMNQCWAICDAAGLDCCDVMGWDFSDSNIVPTN